MEFVRWLLASIIVGTFIVGVLTFASPAKSQQMWVDRDRVAESLATQYKEQPRALGLAANGHVVELWTTTDGETWTITATRPNGQTRLIASGEAWEALPLIIEGDNL